MPIGKKPIHLPEGVEVRSEAGSVLVRGPLGEMKVGLPEGIGVRVEGREVLVQRGENAPPALLGLAYALLRNAVTGSASGFTKELELSGVGYRVEKVGERLLKFSLGFSHPVEYPLPEGVSAELGGNTRVRLSGVDKRVVNQAAAEIRKRRPPEPYKGKGIRYVGEVVRQKPGKAAKAVGVGPGGGSGGGGTV